MRWHVGEEPRRRLSGNWAVEEAQHSLGWCTTIPINLALAAKIDGRVAEAFSASRPTRVSVLVAHIVLA